MKHAKRHQQLHSSLDELAADYMSHNRGKGLSTTSVLTLMQWSYEQTQHPTDNNEDRYHENDIDNERIRLTELCCYEKSAREELLQRINEGATIPNDIVKVYADSVGELLTAINKLLCEHYGVP